MTKTHATSRCVLAALVSTLHAGAQSAAADPATPHKVTFVGTVLGAGAVRARITVYHNLGVSGTVEPVAGGVADSAGAFTMREVPWFRGTEWMYDHVLVAAQAGDRAGLLSIRSDGREAGAAIELRATCRLRGIVRDHETGQPLGGASVWPMIFGDPEKGEPLIWPTEPMVPWHTHTDAEGRFELVGVPVYGCYVLDIRGPQHGRRLVRVDGATQPTDVRLAPAGRIVGRVRRSDGEPAAGVVVWANGGEGFARTRTDAAGTFAFESLAAGRYWVGTAAQAGPKVFATGITVQAGATERDVDLCFGATGTIRGRLLDATTGEPIRGDAPGYVASQGPEASGHRVDSSCRIQADGTFCLEVGPGRNKLTITLPGWTSTTEFAEVRAGEEASLDVRLRQGENARRR